MPRPNVAIFALAIFGCSPLLSNAQTLYGVAWSTPQLVTINLTTGAATVVGSLAPITSPAGLASRGGKFYVWDGGASRIKEINPANGATLATIDIGSTLFGEGDIAFRSDGIGFLAGFAPEFRRFDITVPNSVALPAVTITMDGLAFNAADVLYGLGEGGGSIYTINQVTGVPTLVGNTGLPGTAGGGGLAFDSAGNLFAALSGSSSGPTSLYQINVSTGVATLIGSNPLHISGIRFAGSFVPPIDPPQPPGSEGNYPGSSGPRGGGEGSFGFGGGIPADSMAVLRGPFITLPSGATTLVDLPPGLQNVSWPDANFNVTNQGSRQGGAQGNTPQISAKTPDKEEGSVVLSILVGLGLGLGLLALAKVLGSQR